MAVARRNIPLAAADAIEWFSRRLDIAILGLFVAPQFVGIYYVAQQVASMPQKLKTSFDPILAPVITQKLAEGDKGAVARQVRQVGFWIIAAQAGIALALGIPGEALMGLFGDNSAFVGGTARSGLPARRRSGRGDRGGVGGGARLRRPAPQSDDLGADDRDPGGAHRRHHPGDALAAARPQAELQAYQAAGAALALALALGMASILKSRLLGRILAAPVQGWRWSLIWAAAAASVVGFIATLLPEWLELSLGAPAILLTFGLMVWYRGFTAGGPDLVPDARAGGAGAPRLGARDALVAEMPHAGEHHRQARFVGGGDHLLVADRAARLDHRRRARLGRGQQAVGEGEEGVGRHRRADRARLRPSPLSPPRPSPSRRRCAPIRAGSSGRRRCRRWRRPWHRRWRST